MSETNQKHGPIRRFLVGTWVAIDFSRRLIFNLLFLAILLFILVMQFAPSGVKGIKKETALVLNLSGELVEQYTADDFSRALAKAQGGGPVEIQLRDVLKALELAKDDPKIDRVLLNVDGFYGGLAAMRELGDAIDEFKQSGKKVIAHGIAFEQRGYYIAAHADEVYMDREGAILLEGLGRYRMYYREALADKLGVDVHLFRVGEYKSAAEPYILDGPSEYSKQSDLHWMGDLWQRFVTDVASARGMDVADIETYVNDFPALLKSVSGDMAQLALDRKFIDGFKTEEELSDMMAELGAEDDDYGFRSVGLQRYLLVKGAMQPSASSRPSVGVVVAQGSIVGGSQPQGTIGGASTAELLRNAREDENIKAIVLRVDSGGGEVYASEQIRREVELAQAAGKPVVVSMGNVAASGGYWISMNADAIYADESTITGSIGIFGLWMSFPRTLEKIGVRSGGVGTTPLAGAFDPARPMDPAVGDVIQTVIDHGYSQFIGKVAAARESTAEKIDEVARGRVWSGAQAKELGLVDELGGLRAAIADAAKRAKMSSPNPDVFYVEFEKSPFEQFLAGMKNASMADALVGSIAPFIGDRASTQLRDDLKFLDSAARSQRGYQTFAHCFCQL